MKMIRNRQISIARSEATEWTDCKSLAETVSSRVGASALRWYVSQVSSQEITIEATSFDDPGDPVPEAPLQFHPGKTAALSIVPTGIGCSIGGYAGDAAPATNLLASAVDYLVTHPNAVNASDFVGLMRDNIVYSDGCSIDLFAKGQVELRLPYANRIGLVIERTDDRQLDIIFNVVNAVRAVYGVDIFDYVITDKPLGGRCVENKSGAFVGTIDNPDELFIACEKLLSRGADAIALTSNISDLPLESYASHFNGAYPNPIGGVEAVISYLVTRRFQVPAAHAPLLNIKELDLKHPIVDARGAGEFASASGLACVLIGLRRAPQIRSRPGSRILDVIGLDNIIAIVAPATSLGGIPMLYGVQKGIPIVAVHSNQTILKVDREGLGLEGVIEVHNYTEAAGVLLALKNGYALETVERPLRTLRYKH
jgi:hypothetical protein